MFKFEARNPNLETISNDPRSETGRLFQEAENSDIKFDELAKSRNPMKIVIPAKAGIQFFKMFWTPAFAGVTLQKTFCETAKFATDFGIRISNLLYVLCPMRFFL
jgi:hypothetical protein